MHGATLGGRYRLEQPLARGAMGELWVGRDLSLDRTVAVKLIGAALGDSAMARSRFQREAKAAARLRSPNVVQVFDHGEDDGVAYIVMELLDGEGVDKRLLRERRLAAPVAVWLADQVAKGLSAAHEAGVVHRDLKPANLFIARSGDDEVVKILDFGIAKLASFDGQVTMSGELLGSPFYMSPEQANGAIDLDYRSDLWSFGAILFCAITGRIAFQAPSLSLVLDRIRSGTVPRARDIDPGLPPHIDDFFSRALALDPKNRFVSARDLAKAFAEAMGEPSVSGLGSTSPPLSGSSSPSIQEVPTIVAPVTTNEAPTVVDTSLRDAAATLVAPHPQGADGTLALPGSVAASTSDALEVGQGTHGGVARQVAPPGVALPTVTSQGLTSTVSSARRRGQRVLVLAGVGTAAVTLLIGFVLVTGPLRSEGEPTSASEGASSSQRDVSAEADARPAPSASLPASAEALPAASSETVTSNKPVTSSAPAVSDEPLSATTAAQRQVEPRTHTVRAPTSHAAGTNKPRTSPSTSEQTRPSAPSPTGSAPRRLDLGY